MNNLKKILHIFSVFVLTYMPTQSFSMDGYTVQEVETDYGTKKIWVDLYIFKTSSPDTAVDFSNTHNLNALHEGDRFTCEGTATSNKLLQKEIDGRDHFRFSHIVYGDSVTEDVSIIYNNLYVPHRPLDDDELSPDLLPYKDVINQFLTIRTHVYTPNS